MHRPASRPAVLLLALAGAATAHADTSRVLDPVSLWLGGYYANTDVDLRASTDVLGTSDVLTGETKLSEGHESVARARLDFVFLESQGLSFDYFGFDRSRTHTLDVPFSYEGTDYAAGTTLKGAIDLSAASATYRFWFGGESDVFGLGLGASYYRAKLRLDGQAIAGDATVSATRRWDEDAIAPTLTLGYKHAFSDDLRLYFDASGVRKNGGALTGHLYDARLGLEWFPWHNVGLGAEYGVSRIRLTRDADLYTAKLDIDLDGPSAFARVRF